MSRPAPALWLKTGLPLPLARDQAGALDRPRLGRVAERATPSWPRAWMILARAMARSVFAARALAISRSSSAEWKAVHAPASGSPAGAGARHSWERTVGATSSSGTGAAAQPQRLSAAARVAGLTGRTMPLALKRRG